MHLQTQRRLGLHNDAFDLVARPFLEYGVSTPWAVNSAVEQVSGMVAELQMLNDLLHPLSLRRAQRAALRPYARRG